MQPRLARTYPGSSGAVRGRIGTQCHFSSIRCKRPREAVRSDRPHFVGHSRCKGLGTELKRVQRATRSSTSYSRDLSTKPRLIQHKNEAFWFYRYLSIVYDKIVNPGHWTEDMRDDALLPAQLDSPNLKVSCFLRIHHLSVLG